MENPAQFWVEINSQRLLRDEVDVSTLVTKIIEIDWIYLQP